MIAPSECPQCGGELWNNVKKKASGSMNAKAPDFSCKDKEGCGWVQWPPKAEKAVGGKPGAKATRYSGPLGPLYSQCLDFAKRVCHHHLGDEVDAKDIIAAAATLFIGACQLEKPVILATKAKPAPPPEPEPDPEEDDHDSSDDFPF